MNNRVYPYQGMRATTAQQGRFLNTSTATWIPIYMGMTAKTTAFRMPRSRERESSTSRSMAAMQEAFLNKFEQAEIMEPIDYVG